jgi:hypothetical protein
LLIQRYKSQLVNSFFVNALDKRHWADLARLPFYNLRFPENFMT